jgi:hypothetical protein
MTLTKSKEEWVKIWKAKSRELYGMYQGIADPNIFKEIQTLIVCLEGLAEDIGDKLEKEAFWKK